MERKIYGLFLCPITTAVQGASPPIPGETETGVRVLIGLPPGVGPGLLWIVRRSEIGDQGSGWTGNQGKIIRWTFLPVW